MWLYCELCGRDLCCHTNFHCNDVLEREEGGDIVPLGHTHPLLLCVLAALRVIGKFGTWGYVQVQLPPGGMYKCSYH